jgi:hypothetical protein
MSALKTLKGIEGLSSLETLNLVDNTGLEDISALDKLHLQKLYIRGCNKKKADFPSQLQDCIDWQSSGS